MKIPFFKTVVLTCHILLFSLSICYAEEYINDGFTFSKVIESRYFTIFIEEGVDLQKLSIELDIPPSLKAIIKEWSLLSENADIGTNLDILFLALSEIMDIHPGDFNCRIKVCKDSSGLSNVAERLFNQDIQPGGFYVSSIDTIYVDSQTIDIHILGHELSHAILCNYFVVPPPVKIQEVLCGYSEYQLRKYTGTLP